jgi:hypothetical protein
MVRSAFIEAGVLPKKSIIEYCWYDDNLNLDKEWLPLLANS